MVQGIKSYRDPALLPQVDLAIIAVQAKYCLPLVDLLLKEKNTRAFIILSAGFSESGEEGREFEESIARMISEAGATLIGPNCIGVISPYYNGIFTTPVPGLSPMGCDLVSGSGATAVFILNQQYQRASVFQVFIPLETVPRQVLRRFWNTGTEHLIRKQVHL